jgi:hypothetical protein
METAGKRRRFSALAKPRSIGVWANRDLERFSRDGAVCLSCPELTARSSSTPSFNSRLTEWNLHILCRSDRHGRPFNALGNCLVRHVCRHERVDLARDVHWIAAASCETPMRSIDVDLASVFRNFETSRRRAPSIELNGACRSENQVDARRKLVFLRMFPRRIACTHLVKTILAAACG